jgi:hypothetical protein
MTVVIGQAASNTPTLTLSRWIDELGSALEKGDVEAATALFGTDSYWRDLSRSHGTS